MGKGDSGVGSTELDVSAQSRVCGTASADGYAHLFESARDGILILDWDSCQVIDANPSLAKIVGVAKPEMIGRVLSEIAPFTHSAVGEAPLDDLRRSGCFNCQELTLIVAEGERHVSIEFTNTVHLHEDRRIIQCDIRDISDRRQAEARRIEDGIRFRQMFEQDVVGINIVGPGGEFLYVNDYFGQMLGYARSDLIGRQVTEIVEKTDQIRFGDEIAMLISGEQESVRSEFTLWKKGGGTLNVLVHGRASVGNARPEIVCVVLDITDQNRAESARLEAEAQFRGLVEQQLTGIYITREDGTVAYMNRRFAEMMGYDVAEIIGQPFTQNIALADLPRLMEGFEALLSGAEPSTQLTFSAKRKNGEPIELIAQSTIATYEGRQAIIGVAMDITALIRAERASARLNRALTTINAAITALVHATGEDELFQAMCRVIVSSGGYPLAWIGVAEHDEAKTVRPVAMAGDDRGYIRDLHISWSDETERGCGPTGTAIRTGKLQVNQSFADNPNVGPWQGRATARGYKSSISLPLSDRAVPIGALTIYASEPDAFGPEEVELLGELGAQLSYGIAALRDLTANAENTKRLQNAMEGAVDALSAASAERDPYTAGHQRRVAELATRIGQEMGLSAFRLRGLHLAAVVHDIGKISVPAEILSKSGKLKKVEFELIKQHAQASYDILKGIEFPWPIAEMVWQHHERLDGSGYPRGLKGDEILLEARVLSVADVVESMMAHRPYRAALGIDAALAEIERGQGTVYDPAAVDACIALFRTKGFAFA